TNTPTTTNDEFENKAPRRENVVKTQENIDEQTANEILAVIYENIDATQAEDIERVLATVYVDSAHQRATVQGMEFIFSNNDLEYVLEAVEVIEINGDDAKVHYIQTKRALQGKGFINMRVGGIHHMKKFGDTWKIFETENLVSEQIP
ncbi:MAG: hypothetical protein KJO12_00420, partial [Ignavibacteria bacterium]|nr:hypothetical protein [Ignavibacteria bacterium]